MTEPNVFTDRKPNEGPRPSCNVSQKFNFTVGVIAVLAALTALMFLVMR